MKTVKIKSIRKIDNNSCRYDITTETGNFFVNGILVHNSSFTAYLKDDTFGVCSRNLELKEDDTNLYWSVAREFEVEKKLRALNKNLCIQGELVGPGIQSNPYKLEKLCLYLFNAFDIDEQKWIKIPVDIDIPVVPVVYLGGVHLLETIEEMLELADGESLVTSGVIREGLVWRPLIHEILDPRIGRLSFKTVSNKFLIKMGE